MSVGRIPGASGIPTTTVLAKGDLIAGTAANAVTNLPVGTNGQVLTAASGQTTGLQWGIPTDTTKVPLSTVTAKGDLIAATASGAVSNLAVGTNGYAVVADSTQTTGLAYKNIVPSQTSNSGKYLTTDGTNTSWATLASGGMTLLSTTTLSGTSTTISSISQSYTDLYIYVYGITGASNNGTLDIQPNSSGSITYQVCLQGNVTPTEFDATVLRCWSGYNGLATDSNNAWYGVIRNYAGSTSKPFFGTGYFMNNSSVSKGVFQSGAILTTSAISSLQVGNGVGMNSGTCKIYGVN